MEQQKLFKVRDKRNRGWFWIENEYFNGFGKILGASALAVYVCLCRHADQEQKCFPSQKAIAEELLLSERTVRDIVKKFEFHRIIEIEKNRTSSGKWLHNVYFLLDKSEWVYPTATIADGSSNGKNEPKPTANNDQNQRQPFPLNNTQSNNTLINNTHPSLREGSAELRKKKSAVIKGKHGDASVNMSIDYLKHVLGASLDGSIPDNRRFASLLLDKVKKDYPEVPPTQTVRQLIDAGMNDNFHRRNLTNFKYLFYNCQKIVQTVKLQKPIVI